MDLFLYCDLDRTELRLRGTMDHADGDALRDVLAKIDATAAVVIDAQELVSGAPADVLAECAQERSIHATGPVAVIPAPG